MSLSDRELWTVIHGMGLGAIFLLAFAGGLAGLWSLRPEWVTVAGLAERLHRLSAGTWIMAVASWLTVVTGTYIVYVWYRATPPAGADLASFPRSFLLNNTNIAAWHTFGMEWKEHVAWLALMLATAVAYVVGYYDSRLAYEEKIRQANVDFGKVFRATLVLIVLGLLGTFPPFFELFVR